MFIPAVYAVALCMIILGMTCWGSWANTQKLCKGWRFELFYWDYVWGIKYETQDPTLGAGTWQRAPAV
jgi:glucose uptake protein